MKYSSSFDYDMKIGQEAEDWAKRLFNGEYKVEVKSDYIAHRTGNVFIEFSSRGKPSGISTTEADYWLYRIDKINCCALWDVNHLKEKLRAYYKSNMYIKRGGDNNTSLGFLIPISELFKR